MKSGKVDFFSRGAPWVRKFGHDVAYARTHFAVVGREQVSAGRGEEYRLYVIIVRWICVTRVFLGGNPRKK